MSHREALPKEIDMEVASDVAWVKARNDPALWHQAAIATVAYLGDKHGFLPWLVQQPNMDRATAGWLLFWLQGSRYLCGEQSDYGARIPDGEVVQLLNLLCTRSERIGFSDDRIGLEADWEPRRLECLGVVAKGEVAEGITVPCNIINTPFNAPRQCGDYEVHDGVLVSLHFLRSQLPHLSTSEEPPAAMVPGRLGRAPAMAPDIDPAGFSGFRTGSIDPGMFSPSVETGNSMDALELPTMEARRWIAGAARECGYPAEFADALGYSAWWLENRGMGGVLRATVYLLAIHGKSYGDLQSQARGETLVCLCPIAYGALIAARAQDNASEFSEWVGGISTADPVLMVPLIAQFLDYRFDVCLRYNDQDLVFFEDGATVLSNSLAAMSLINADVGVDTTIRLVDSSRREVSPTHRYMKKDTLLVPKFRYTEGGGFRFDRAAAR